MKINPAHIEIVKDLVDRGPYFELLGMKLTDLSEGSCTFEIDVERSHMNAFGGIHGGAYASFLDSACYWALYCTMDENMGFTTIDLQTNNLRSCKSGHIVVEGKVIKQGGTICLSEATITDEQGRLLAQGTSKILVSPTLQSLEHIIATVDPDVVLPPKFIED